MSGDISARLTLSVLQTRLLILKYRPFSLYTSLMFANIQENKLLCHLLAFRRSVTLSQE